MLLIIFYRSIGRSINTGILFYWAIYRKLLLELGSLRPTKK